MSTGAKTRSLRTQPNAVSQEFAARVRTARTALGWSRYELSRQCARRQGQRWHQTVIIRFEDLEAIPNLVQAVVLCDVLGLTLTDLALEPRPEPWIDGSSDTLAEIDDRIHGYGVVEVLDRATGAREEHAVVNAELADLDELPEIREEDR